MGVALSKTGAAAARMAAPSSNTSIGVTFTFFTFFLLKPVKDKSSSSESGSFTTTSPSPASTVGSTRKGANASAASFDRGCIFGASCPVSLSPPNPSSSSFTASSFSTLVTATSSTPGLALSEFKLTICLKMLSSIVLSFSFSSTFTPTCCSSSCVTETLPPSLSGVTGSTLLECKVASDSS